MANETSSAKGPEPLWKRLQSLGPASQGKVDPEAIPDPLGAPDSVETPEWMKPASVTPVETPAEVAPALIEPALEPLPPVPARALAYSRETVPSRPVLDLPSGSDDPSPKPKGLIDRVREGVAAKERDNPLTAPTILSRPNEATPPAAPAIPEDDIEGLKKVYQPAVPVDKTPIGATLSDPPPPSFDDEPAPTVAAPLISADMTPPPPPPILGDTPAPLPVTASTLHPEGPAQKMRRLTENQSGALGGVVPAVLTPTDRVVAPAVSPEPSPRSVLLNPGDLVSFLQKGKGAVALPAVLTKTRAQALYGIDLRDRAAVFDTLEELGVSSKDFPAIDDFLNGYIAFQDARAVSPSLPGEPLVQPGLPSKKDAASSQGIWPTIDWLQTHGFSKEDARALVVTEVSLDDIARLRRALVDKGMRVEDVGRILGQVMDSLPSMVKNQPLTGVDRDGKDKDFVEAPSAPDGPLTFDEERRVAPSLFLDDDLGPAADLPATTFAQRNPSLADAFRVPDFGVGERPSVSTEGVYGDGHAADLRTDAGRDQVYEGIRRVKELIKPLRDELKELKKKKWQVWDRKAKLRSDQLGRQISELDGVCRDVTRFVNRAAEPLNRMLDEGEVLEKDPVVQGLNRDMGRLAEFDWDDNNLESYGWQVDWSGPVTEMIVQGSRDAGVLQPGSPEEDRRELVEAYLNQGPQGLLNLVRLELASAFLGGVSLQPMVMEEMAARAGRVEAAPAEVKNVGGPFMLEGTPEVREQTADFAKALQQFLERSNFDMRKWRKFPVDRLGPEGVRLINEAFGADEGQTNRTTALYLSLRESMQDGDESYNVELVGQTFRALLLGAQFVRQSNDPDKQFKLLTAYEATDILRAFLPDDLSRRADGMMAVVQTAARSTQSM